MFRLLAENVLDYAIFVVDPHRHILSWSKGAEHLLGFTEAEILGRQCDCFFTPEDVRAGVPQRELDEALRTGRGDDDRWHQRKDGTRFWASGAVTPLRDEGGRLRGFAKIMRDRTDLKRAQDELAASRKRLQALFDNTLDAVLLADDRGRYVDANAAACTLLGYGRDELLRLGVADVTPAANADAGRAAWAAFLRDGRQEGEFTVRRKDGATAVVEFRAVANAQPGLHLSVLRDVTERGRVRAALEQSEARLAGAQRIAGVGSWEVDWPTQRVRWSAETYRLLGVDPAAYEPTVEGYLALVPDEDRPAVLRARDAALAGAAAYRVDHRVVRPDGSVRWVSEQAEVEFGPGGPVRVFGTVLDVTDRVRAGEALRASEERLRTLSDNLPDGAVYQAVAAPGGGRRFAFISAGVERVFGVTPAEAAADAAALYGLVHEDDRDRLAAAEAAALRDNAPFDCEFRSRTRGGDVRWVHCRSAPRRLPTGETVWEGIVMDVTARRRSEREAQVHRDRLDLVVNSVDIGLWYCDLPFGELVWNAKVKEHFGLPPDADVTIDTFYDRLHPADRERTRGAIEASIRDRTGYDIEYRTVGPDGRERWVRAIGRTFYAPSGEPVSFDGVTVDVTQRVRQEEALKDADRRKDEFLATLAHELRNPLAPLRNGLQILRLSRGDAAAADRAMGMMDRQLGQMVHLVDDLLDVSRITRGKLHLRRDRVELAAVVRNAVEASRPLVEAAGHRLAVSLPPEPVHLDADPTRLAQVLSNLLTNAAKYTERGGDIRLAAERRGDGVVVSVRDTGIGIAAEHLPRLFEMFSQVDSALERSPGGLGIGLALVRGLVEMHGGTVEARSEGRGRGSEFVVRLPLPGDPPAGPARADDDSGPAAARPRRRVLVADDNRDAADSLAEMLRLFGHEVHAAHDGREAVEAAAWFRPEVALLDIGMPRLNGYEAARLIREQADRRRVVLVAVTGWGQEDDRRRGAEAGFDAHLTKPVAPADLDRLLTGLTPQG